MTDDLRKSYYSNFYQSSAAIKQTGRLTAVCGGEDRIVFVSPKDIAAAAAEELVTSAPSQVRYVGSEELTCNEAARIIGTAIGNPSLHWTTIAEEQLLAAYKGMGLPDALAKSFVEMEATMHNGTALANFHRANPTLGKVKLADFAKEFAVAYQAH
ncbi:hypothetical protein A0257_15140 [Hymenobacter psoromatis]|nr:hypothetical protein A0257_15140 [Hymenobacter psoromatis]